MTRDGNEDDDRREFLKTCGRFAAVTPPVMTLLLSTSLTSKAIARSGGLNGARQSDSGQSFFDNDRSTSGPASSSGGSSGGGGAPGGLPAGSSHAGGTSGGGAGGSGGAGAGGGNAKGPFATGGGSGIPSADGGVDCADEENEEKRRADCPGASTRISSATQSSR